MQDKIKKLFPLPVIFYTSIGDGNWQKDYQVVLKKAYKVSNKPGTRLYFLLPRSAVSSEWIWNLSKESHMGSEFDGSPVSIFGLISLESGEPEAIWSGA